ncbi:hypothetical protein D9M73_91930 [compost metagenome]
MPLAPGQGLDGRAKFIGQRLGFFGRAIEQADLFCAAVRQAQHHGPRRAACAQHGDGAGIGTPVGFCIEQALDVAKAVVVETLERAVRPDHDGVHRTHASGVGVHLVHQLERIHLVRQGDVAAAKAQRRQARNGDVELARRDRQLHIGTRQTVLLDPVVVDQR